MANLSESKIESTLHTYGVGSIPGLATRIHAYIDLLLKWNRTISLTTVTDPDEIVKFHFGESLFAVSQLQIEKSRLADVGTGAGFPGLPLAMAIPALEVTLIESNVKKSAFLAEVIRRLKLSNVTVYKGRMESFPLEAPPFDVVTARALGQFDELLDWSHTHLAAGGRVLLWLGDSDAVDISGRPGWSWDPPQAIPGSVRRVVLSGSPKR
jgi:16S rRNA (guanine527-N7)-methyltransferase